MALRLDDALNALLEVLLARRGDDFVVPERKTRQLAPGENNTISMLETVSPDWSEVAPALAPDYLSLKQLDVAKEALIEDVDLLQHEDDAASKAQAAPYIDVLVARYFELAGGVALNDEAFEAAMAEIREFIAAEILDAELFSPIAGLQDASGSTQLAESVWLSPLDPEDRSRIWDRLSPRGGMPVVWPGDVMSWSHALRVSVPIVPFQEPNWSPHQRLMQHGLAALQLAASKPVASVATFMEPGPRHAQYLRRASMIGGMVFGPALYAQHRQVGPLAEPPEDLAQLFTLHSEAVVDDAVDLAMRRLAGAFVRDTDEDRIIDYWIALEALFLPETQELSYRAAVRLAHFVGTDSASREEVYDLARASYSLRSAVVHGLGEGRSQRKNLDLSDLTHRTRGLVRLALTKWLNPAVNHSPKALDRAVIGAA